MDFSVQQFPLNRLIQLKELSPSVHWAQNQRLSNDYEMVPRQIYDFELIFLKEGEILLHLGEDHTRLSAGNLLFLSAGIPHHIKILSEPDVFMLSIHFDFFDELDIQTDEDIIVKEISIDPNRFCREPLITGFQPFSKFPIMTGTPRMIQGMEQIIEEFTLRQPGYELACKGYMQQLITQLLRSQLKDKRELSPVWGHKMMELAGWIESNYGDDCSNVILARLVNLNEDYMAKQFRAAMGMPPHKFVQSIRHRESKRLLRESDEPIESVGQIVGYPDIHYFCRIFDKWEGITPGEYRKLSRIF